MLPSLHQVTPALTIMQVLAPIMAPRPHSGLETHEEEIIGDSPTIEPYLHHISPNATDDYDDLDKEEEGEEQISVIIGIVMALILVIIIVIVCAAIIRRHRQRPRLPASTEDGKGMRLKRVKRGKGMEPDNFEEDEPSPVDDLGDPFTQFVYIPPNKGLKLWKGRLKIMSRHIKRSLLHKQIEIHGCTIPEHCRAQLKRIYVY